YLLLGRSLCRYVFFFQAEDGIRVFHVTGVQTCALPISGDVSRSRPPICRRFISGSTRRGSAGAATQLIERSTACPRSRRTPGPRSEERRVGKECRSRGAP